MFNGKRIASIVFILLILVVSILCTIGTAKGLNAFNTLNGYSYSLSDELKVLHNVLVVILVFVIISFVLELIAFGVSFSDYFEKKNVLILFLPIIAFSLSDLITGFMAMSSYSYDTQGAVIAEIVLEFLVLFSFLLACATEEKASCYIVAIASVFKIICLIIAMVSLSEEGLALAGDIIGLIALVFFVGFMFVAANDADYSYFRTSKTTSYSSHNYGPYRVGAVVYNKFELYDDAGVKIRGPTTPTTPKRHWFGLFRVRSPLLAESQLFSLPAGTKMFQFPAFASSFDDNMSSTC